MPHKSIFPKFTKEDLYQILKPFFENKPQSGGFFKSLICTDYAIVNTLKAFYQSLPESPNHSLTFAEKIQLLDYTWNANQNEEIYQLNMKLTKKIFGITYAIFPWHFSELQKNNLFCEPCVKAIQRYPELLVPVVIELKKNKLLNEVTLEFVKNTKISFETLFKTSVNYPAILLGAIIYDGRIVLKNLIEIFARFRQENMLNALTLNELEKIIGETTPFKPTQEALISASNWLLENKTIYAIGNTPSNQSFVNINGYDGIINANLVVCNII